MSPRPLHNPLTETLLAARPLAWLLSDASLLHSCNSAALEDGKQGSEASKDAAVVVSDVSSGSDEEDPNASGATKTYRAVRKAIQTSTIWKALNYGMNFDIHKVRESECNLNCF